MSKYLIFVIFLCGCNHYIYPRSCQLLSREFNDQTIVYQVGFPARHVLCKVGHLVIYRKIRDGDECMVNGQLARKMPDNCSFDYELKELISIDHRFRIEICNKQGVEDQPFKAIIWFGHRN